MLGEVHLVVWSESILLIINIDFLFEYRQLGHNFIHVCRWLAWLQHFMRLSCEHIPPHLAVLRLHFLQKWHLAVLFIYLEDFAGPLVLLTWAKLAAILG